MDVISNISMMGIYHGCIKLNILWLMLLYHLLVQVFCHRLYLKLIFKASVSYAYLPCTPRVSDSRTTFALCILFYCQTSRPFSHQM